MKSSCASLHPFLVVLTRGYGLLRVHLLELLFLVRLPSGPHISECQCVIILIGIAEVVVSLRITDKDILFTWDWQGIRK